MTGFMFCRNTSMKNLKSNILVLARVQPAGKGRDFSQLFGNGDTIEYWEQFGLPSTRKTLTDHVEKMSSIGHEDSQGLEHRMYEGRLRELGLFSMGRRQQRGILPLPRAT